MRVSQTKARREVPESTHYKLAVVGAGIWLRCLTVLQHSKSSHDETIGVYKLPLAQMALRFSS